MKNYEINGVISYVHCYSMEIEADSKEEATKIAEEQIGEHINKDNAEYEEYSMDEPRII